MPPSSYTNSYSSSPTSLNCNATYPIKQLFDAANTPIAVCPITNFATATPFNPLAWAQRLAATRYPNPAAAVALVKCLRLGVDLGFYGERSNSNWP